jgi:hypothetical protein
VSRPHDAVKPEPGGVVALPVPAPRAPRRFEYIWTPDRLYTFEQRAEFPFFIGVGDEIYAARSAKDGTIQKTIGRFSGCEIVDYFPHKGVAPSRALVKDYRAAVALERQHGQRIDQELGRSAAADQRDGAREAERRRSSKRRAGGRAVSPVRDRRARA